MLTRKILVTESHLKSRFQTFFTFILPSKFMLNIFRGTCRIPKSFSIKLVENRHPNTKKSSVTEKEQEKMLVTCRPVSSKRSSDYSYCKYYKS